MADETKAKDPSELGVSLVSLYKRSLNENFKEIEGKMRSFWEEEINQIWEIFSGAQRVIGFNSIRFDIPALSPYSPAYFSKLPHFDILEEIKKIQGRRTSLNALARDTLGVEKIDSGANAISYYQKGDKESLAKLKKYCEADVLITRDIYDYVLAHRSLKFKDHWNNPREIKIVFSYPPQDPTSQNTLF